MPAHNLPHPSTPFIGRAEELSEVATLLSDPACRLLTLVGPGGMGKTRLALQAAADQLPHFTDGVFFVSLASVGSPDLLVSAIVETLSLTLYGSEPLSLHLMRYLRERQILLVLDNFEHLLEGVLLLTDILQAAPKVKLLVTSRERLNVQEEWVLSLEGLAFPDVQATSPLESYSAVQLFMQRARQVQTKFSFNENAEAVQAICQAVEGMPLGLELAATWLRAMSCRQIVAQMKSSLDFLTTPLRNAPERHRSLRAVFEQSWNLLSQAEKDILMRVSVFRGSFDLEAAEQVAGASLPALAGLVDKSLIRLNANGRYDLHELLRQYAADKLIDAGEGTAMVERHLDYFLKLAQSFEAHAGGREQIAWRDRLEIELDNLRAALAWSVEAETGLQLAGTLGKFFFRPIHWKEGFDWLEQTTSANPNAPASLRATALNHMGYLAVQLGNLEQGRAFCEQALTLARAVHDRANIAHALSNLGFYVAETFDQSPELVEESLALYREIGDLFGVSYMLLRRAYIAVEQRDYAYARLLVEEDLVLARDTGDQFVMAWAHNLLGTLSWFQDHDLRQAREDFERSAALFRESSHPQGLLNSLCFWAAAERTVGNTARAQALFDETLVQLQAEVNLYNDFPVDFAFAGLASIACTRGQLERAARLLGAMNPLVIAGFEKSYPGVLTFSDDVAAVHAQLGEVAFDEAWAHGQALSRKQMIAYALEDSSAPAQLEPDETRDALPTSQSPKLASQSLTEPLSERELEVLRLIGEGLSNPEIAQKLYLSVGTIKVHTRNIYGKLSVNNRTEAVVQAQKMNLL